MSQWYYAVNVIAYMVSSPTFSGITGITSCKQLQSLCARSSIVPRVSELQSNPGRLVGQSRHYLVTPSFVFLTHTRFSPCQYVISIADVFGSNILHCFISIGPWQFLTSISLLPVHLICTCQFPFLIILLTLLRSSIAH